MNENAFRMMLYLPAQGASELEATVIEWYVSEGDIFLKGQALAQIDSAKSVFDFESPCAGKVIRRLPMEGDAVLMTEPLLEIETEDEEMKNWIPPAVNASCEEKALQAASAPHKRFEPAQGVVLLGVGGYLPARVVTNAELVRGFPDISADYVYQVTGIQERRWASDDEKPSGMA
ncbi:MAG: biotin/lipoyl-containing protein, partial [Thermoguttaceae bacterium]